MRFKRKHIVHSLCEIGFEIRPLKTYFFKDFFIKWEDADVCLVMINSVCSQTFVVVGHVGPHSTTVSVLS